MFQSTPLQVGGHIISWRSASSCPTLAGVPEAVLGRRHSDSEMGCDKHESISVARFLTALAVLAALGLECVYAQDQRIAQMVHTVWTGRDGAPQGITALAQTPDGTLWIASNKGLYMFDGLTFLPFEPGPASPKLSPRTIRFLHVSKSGELWIVPSGGPPSSIHNGMVTIYDRSPDEPIEDMFSPQENSKGVMWAIRNGRRLVYLGQDGVWHPLGDSGLGPGHIQTLFIDSSDTQWVVKEDVLYQRAFGQERFTSTGIYVYGPSKIAEYRDHSLLLPALGARTSPRTPPLINLQRVDRLGRPMAKPANQEQLLDIMAVPDGSLWVMTLNGALQHLQAWEIDGGHYAHERAADVFQLEQGVGHALIRDTDGNIWVGGLGRLEKFGHSTLEPAIPGASPGTWLSCVDSHDDVWISRFGDKLFRLSDGHLSQIPLAQGPAHVFCGKNAFYVFGYGGVGVLRRGRVVFLPLPPGLVGFPNHFILSGLLPLPGHSFILAVVGANIGHQLWHYKEGRWRRLPTDEAVSATFSMMFDSQGHLYVGHLDGTISILDADGRVLQTLSTGSPGLGPIIGFTQTSYGLFLLGARGIALEGQGSLRSLSFEHPSYAQSVNGLVEAHNGDLWLNGLEGIVHVPSAEVRAAIANSTHRITATNIQEGDFVGPVSRLSFNNSAHLDSHGRLWFSTLNGVVSVDPEHWSPPHPPQVKIRAITADGSAPDAHGTFPPNIAGLDVQYFGLNLSNPRGVIYRYRLEGVDHDWQDVGHRTDAIYTHLRPGSYVFCVMASNGDGIWTTPVVSTPFTVLPSFYQTWWFTAMCALASALLLWLGVRARVKYVAHAIRLRAEERADERIRIARELHDTLLQGVQGLLLSFHVAAQKVAADHESKAALDKALATADRIILEGRNRVTRLRSENLSDAELKPSIEGFAADLNGTAPTVFTVERRGGSETLQAQVVDEIFCITREALTNAFRHSEASRIMVELDYQKREFRMACRDNGRGFDPGALLASQKNGHWGLRGMAERAERIGADFRCTSAAEKGTEVQVVVPARRAYLRTSRFRQLFTGNGTK
jgi:signal transduction histidine kinase/ligand-binding sensor domain-containing protein